jgi:two-component system, sensor histidine kinase and response regulator
MEKIESIEKADAYDENNVKVLVVDDQISTVMLIQKHLETLNFDVSAAYNGKQAVELFDKDNNPFDLVILDIMMPYLNGYEVCRILREKYSLYQLPILFLTAKSSIYDMMTGFDVGGNDYLAKPFDSKELLSRSKNLIKLKRLTESNKVLKQAIELKTSLHQMTVHDLKNPLSSIKTLSSLILQETDAESQHFKYLNMIIDTSNNMFNLVNDFLEMDKLESGNVHLSKEVIDMDFLVKVVVNSNIENAVSKKQTVRFIPNDTENRYVFADPTRIREVIDNLVGNAIKYTPLGGSILIEIVYNETNIVLKVKDSGPGLTDEDQIKLFTKFSKLSAKPTGEEKSSGLGLAISKQLVELHDGKIWAENNPDQGACFCMELEAVDKSLYDQID